MDMRRGMLEGGKNGNAERKKLKKTTGCIDSKGGQDKNLRCK